MLACNNWAAFNINVSFGRDIFFLCGPNAEHEQHYRPPVFTWHVAMHISTCTGPAAPCRVRRVSQTHSARHTTSHGIVPDDNPVNSFRASRLPTACSVGWFVSLLVHEEVLLAGLCERKILFRLKIYDQLRQATAKRTCCRLTYLELNRIILGD